MDDLAYLKNQWVCFKLRDIFVPPAQEILERLHGEDVLQGRIVGVTEKGEREEVYVLIEVVGLESAVAVPLPRIVRVV
jgi:hypothetical protein